MRLGKFLRVSVLLVLGLVGVYAGVGFLGVPWAAKHYGVPELSKVLGRPIFLNEVAFDPFAFTLKVEGFEIQEVDGSPMVGFGQLFVDFEFTSVLDEAYRFENIRVSLPFGLIKIQEDGRLNLAALGGQDGGAASSSSENQQPDGGQPAEEPLPFVDIGLLAIEQGTVEFRDETKSPPYIADIVPIQMTVRDFSTRPGNQNSYRIAAEMGEGERLEWQGHVFLDPLRSHGQVDIGGLRAGTLWQYVQDMFRFEIFQGLLDLHVDYDLNMSHDPIGLVLKNGTLTLRNFALREKGQSDALMVVPSFSIRGIEADMNARQVFVETVQSRGTEVRGWMDQNGLLNYQTLFASDEDSPKAEDVDSTPSASPTRSDPPWSGTIQKIVFDEYEIRFEDRQPETPVPFHIEGFSLQAQNVTTDLKKAIALELGFTVNQSGKIAIGGNITPDPLMGTLKVGVSQFAFPPFQPYLEPLVQFHVERGALSVQGHTRFETPTGKEPNVQFSGDLSVDDFALVDVEASQEFLKWEQLALQGLSVESQPTKVNVREIGLKLPYAKMVRGEDGTFNVSRLFSPPNGEGRPSDSEGLPQEEPGNDHEAITSEKESETGKPPPVITIDTVSIANGTIDFLDQAIDPHVVTGIQNLTGSIQGLSSQELSKADVSLNGRVDDVATLKIQGKINPLQKDLYTDIALAFQNLDLTTASPYSGKYLGYPITKGKLTLDLDYSVSEHILIGENQVHIDQLTLGDATDSPEAPSLPVPLALALLKDRKGQIDIDLPVRGDLNNPEFSYGQLVFQALVNLITKAATSPFSMIGGLLGGDGDDLAVVKFSPGQSTLLESEKEKLANLASALSQRPALRLEITGGAESTKDGLILAEGKLEDQLQRLWQEELTATGQTEPASVTKNGLTPTDRKRLLTKLYEQKFGQNLVEEEGGAEGPSSSPEALATPGKGESPGGSQPSMKQKKVPSLDEMRQRLVESISITEDELRLLAQERARHIRDFLVSQNQIPEERVFLVEVNLDAKSEENLIFTNLTLTAQ